MIITNITAYPIQAPGRTLVPVMVETDCGIYGVGEAGLQRRPLAIHGAIEHLKRFLIGEDPGRIEHLWQRMFRGGFYPADRIIGSAISAIDIALWDIKGKKLKEPVYELLGGRCRDYVQCYTHSINYYSADSATPHIDDIVTMCKTEYLERDSKFIRLAPASEGSTFNSRKELMKLLQIVKRIRGDVGEEIEVLIDLHCRFDPEEAIWFCREAEKYHPYFIEDPIRAENYDVYRHLRKHTSIPFAAGEHCSSKWDFKTLIEENLIDFARIDPCIAGGITEAKKIAGWCETHYIKIVPHNPLGPVCTAAGLHLDLSCSNFALQELAFLPGTLLPDVFHEDYKLDGTRLLPPAAPGLGVEFDPAAASRHPYEFTEPPHFQRPDGSFTNN